MRVSGGMRTRLLTLLLALATSLVLPRDADACMCADAASPCAVAAPTDAVFVGTPVSKAPDPANANFLVFTFTVEQSMVGTGRATVEVRTATDEGMCGYDFAIGTKYLVYARSDASRLQTSSCSRTGPLESRADDMALFREMAEGRARTRVNGQVVVWFADLGGALSRGQPVGALPNVAVVLEGNGQRKEALTDRDGRFQVMDLPAGVYDIKVDMPSPFVPMFDLPNHVSVRDCLGETLVLATTMPLSGVIRTADGAPAPDGVMLRLARLGESNNVSFEQTATASTEDGGRWEFPGLWPGRYIVGINVFDNPDGRTPYPSTWFPAGAQKADARVFDVHPERPQSVEFRLPQVLEGVTIRGRVVDASGAPRAGIRVALVDDARPKGPESQPDDVARTVTDATGEFTMSGFSGRRYHVVVQASPRFGISETSVAVPSDPGQIVTIALAVR